jgi:hypothetical protein
MVCF